MAKNLPPNIQSALDALAEAVQCGEIENEDLKMITGYILGAEKKNSKTTKE